MNRLIKYATVNSGREGRICERPKIIGWSLSQAGAPEMGIFRQQDRDVEPHVSADPDPALVPAITSCEQPSSSRVSGCAAAASAASAADE